MTITSKIIGYFEENPDVFINCIEELDSWSGYLGDDRFYYMDELGEMFYGQDATEILTRAFFGYDADSWHTDSHGEKEYGPFNPMRNYFTFNGYGNLVSADEKDYSCYLDEHAIEVLAENVQHIDAIQEDDELAGLFNDYNGFDC
jgi:hypothetical protein